MCLIIDANCAPETLCPEPSDDFSPIINAILNKTAVMMMGGTKQLNEYKKLARVWRFIAVLDRAGRVAVSSTAAIDALQEELEKSGVLRSDDPHIIALAQISGARLLCSKDEDLHADFKSKALLDKPRGNVYQKESHTPLIRKCCTG